MVFELLKEGKKIRRSPVEVGSISHVQGFLPLVFVERVSGGGGGGGGRQNSSEISMVVSGSPKRW